MFINSPNKTKNFEFIHSIKDHINDKDFYHLLFFVNNFEDAILNREFHLIKLEMRYLYELVWHLIESGLRSKPDLQKKFDVEEYFVKIERYKTSKDKNHEKHKSFSAVFKKVSDKGHMKKEIYDLFSNTYKELHKYLHYNNSTVENIRDEVRYSDIKLEDSLMYAKFFFDILMWMFKNIYKINYKKLQSTFNKEYYNGYDPLINNFVKKEYVSDIYKTQCKICGEGTIEKPDDKIFVYGPYLQCNNNDCKSILGKNLKLKSQKLENESCPTNGCKGEIKEVYNYPYESRYMSCNKCSYNTRKNQEEVLGSD